MCRHAIATAETQLVSSASPTDPASWVPVFPPEPPLGFIPLGAPGTFDSNYVAAAERRSYTPTAPEFRSTTLETTWVTSLRTPHDADGIGLAEIGLDGWAGYATSGAGSAPAVVGLLGISLKVTRWRLFLAVTARLGAVGAQS